MKITFKIDPADLFRRGINAATPIVSLEIDPSTLPKEHYELIGRHLLNTGDGCNAVHDSQRAMQPEEVVPIGGRPGADLVEAKDPTLESLLEALTKLESYSTCSIPPELLAHNYTSNNFNRTFQQQ